MYLYKKLFPLLIFFALYLLFFGKILFNEKIIYGGNISYQYHTIINDFALNIENSIYPFFSFDYPGSIDYLGESQQSLLNPIKLILIKILTNYNFVDTYFILLSLFIYFFSTTKFIKFIYGKKKYKYLWINFFKFIYGVFSANFY